ncbi:MAG: hypothetical protein HYZ93_05395 [Candidatus Omnitrophica bacterium]|nr:hypothetical protein [Candidatus Omnitrophota bacterium]
MIDTLWQRIVDLLVKSYGVDRLKLDVALRSRRARGRTLEQILEEEGIIKLGQILVEEGWVKREDLLEIFSKSFQIPPINLARYG